MPDVRHKIDGTRERLADLHGEAQAYLGPFELAEPDEDEVAEVCGAWRSGRGRRGDLPLRVL